MVIEECQADGLVSLGAKWCSSFLIWVFGIGIIKVVKIGLSSLLFGLLFFSCYSNGSRYILNPFQ
jgi:hypothetical protein